MKHTTKLLLAVFAPYIVFALCVTMFGQNEVELKKNLALVFTCLPSTAWAMFEICPRGRTGKYMYNFFGVVFPHIMFYCTMGYLFAATSSFGKLNVEAFAGFLMTYLIAGGIAWLIAVDLIRKVEREEIPQLYWQERD